MSIDSRLRDGLQRSMSSIDSDAERHLEDARRRGRRRVFGRRATLALALAALVAVVALGGPSVLETFGRGLNRPATDPAALPLPGTYTTTITTQEAAGDAAAAGTWLLVLDRSGTLELSSLTNGDFVRDVTQYQFTQGEFLTAALASDGCIGVGRYAWSREGSELSFVSISDACTLRAKIFSSHPWTAD